MVSSERRDNSQGPRSYGLIGGLDTERMTEHRVHGLHRAWERQSPLSGPWHIYHLPPGHPRWNILHLCSSSSLFLPCAQARLSAAGAGSPHLGGARLLATLCTKLPAEHHLFPDPTVFYLWLWFIIHTNSVLAKPRGRLLLSINNKLLKLLLSCGRYKSQS